MWVDVKYNDVARDSETFYLDVYDNGSWKNISVQEEKEFTGAPYFDKTYTYPLYEKVGDKELAIFWYKSALEAPQEKGGFIKEEYKKLTPCIALTKLYFDKGEVNKSLHYHNLAATENPKHPAVVYNETFFKNYLKK